MASIMDRLRMLGIGTTQAEPRKTPAPIEERQVKKAMTTPSNVEYEFTYDVGRKNYIDPGSGFLFNPPTAPTPQSARPPARREITPPAPANREMPRDVLPLVESPVFPPRLPAETEVPIPTSPDMSPVKRKIPIPGPNEFTPPAMKPMVEKPTFDTTIENLLARYDGLYGQPPVAPEPRMPERQDLGLPAFTTPGYLPEGLMTPRVKRPNMQSPAMQNYQPDMFRGQLPMPDMPEFDFGKYRYDYTPDLSKMTKDEFDRWAEEMLRDDPYSN
jgi:hypothetical protein